MTEKEALAKYHDALKKVVRVNERPEIGWPIDAEIILTKAQGDYLTAANKMRKTTHED